MKYEFVTQYRQEFEVKAMCQVLGISESGSYGWKQRRHSQREREDRQLLEQIQQAYQHGRQMYGSPRIHAQLQAMGIGCGKNLVARLMRRAGWRAVHKRHRRLTTDSKHPLPVAPHVLQRDFTASAPTTK